MSPPPPLPGDITREMRTVSCARARARVLPPAGGGLWRAWWLFLLRWLWREFLLWLAFWLRLPGLLLDWQPFALLAALAGIGWLAGAALVVWFFGR